MQNSDATDLGEQVRRAKHASFIRLNGGAPILMTGALYWFLLGLAGYRLSVFGWAMLAFWCSGLMLPVAIGLAKLTGNPFMKDRTVVSDVLLPAFVSMGLIWPILISAAWNAPQMVSLILAIGLSLHFPVIGWAYGKTALYCTHAVVRAIVVFSLWNWLPDTRLTILPFTVSAMYLITILMVLWTVRRDKAAATRSIASPRTDAIPI